MDNRETTLKIGTGSLRRRNSTRYTLRAELPATPIPSTKLHPDASGLLDTQTTFRVFGFALATRHSLALSDVEGPLATAFLQSLQFGIRPHANSRRFRDIAKINRYKITLLPIRRGSAS